MLSKQLVPANVPRPLGEKDNGHPAGRQRQLDLVWHLQPMDAFANGHVFGPGYLLPWPIY